ncbi:DUF4350 domain-containing protein [Psychrobacter arenosus]|uniref:DUF4350 domain-containing protein n=1 Tax=Psychrobacter arenosus TaxID=256326 RepID=UPI001917BB0B|nr:DUF4350 domain-containing protein [Psychrobacter arenosus]
MPNNTSPRATTPQSSGSKFSLSAYNISPAYAIGVLLVVGLISLITWWFFTNFERVSNTDYQLRAQAQYNPYYAAELLINNQHGAKDSQNTVAMTLLDSDLKTLLDDLPPLNQGKNAPQPTLIINSIGSKLTDARFEQLRSWVEQGGHVITFTTDSNNPEDMQAVQARLDELQQAQSRDPVTEIVNDAELAKLISQLNPGNQFLSQLGIYAVAFETDASDDDMAEIGAQIDALITEIESAEQDKPVSDAEHIKNILARLAAQQPLSLLPLANMASSTPAVASTDAAILVQSEHSGQELNTDLLQAWYPATAKVHHYSPKSYNSQNQNAQKTDTNSKNANSKSVKNDPALPAQAALIRQYLTQQQRLLKQNTTSELLTSELLTDQAKPIANRATKTNAATKATQSAQSNDVVKSTKATQSRKLDQLITAVLALSDEQLLGLFKPIDDIYLDIGFGQGRISVLVDSDSFANPNPNLDLPKDASDSRVDERPSLDTPLATWVQSDYYINLLSADNAAWLTYLTQNSSQVWILPNVDIDPLPVMLWKQARPAILGLALLALLWLWSLFNRFGKMKHLPDEQSHDILRYFRQVGRYGWQQDKAAQLLEVTRAQVRQQLAKLTATSEGTRTGMTNDALTVQQSYATDMTALNQVLTAQLEQKKQRYTKVSPSNVSEHNGIKASSPNDELENLLTNLLANEAFIRAQITPERLQAALLTTAKEGNTAFELTQMTQTLWTVQWLLK